MKSINYYNRSLKKYEQENIFKVSQMDFLFNTFWGRFLFKYVLSSKLFSRIYTRQYNSLESVKLIPDFIDRHNLDMKDFQEKEYANFNDFFSREFKQDKRPFDSTLNHMGAFCEGRYLAYASFTPDKELEVKGLNITLKQIMGLNLWSKWHKYFEHGPILISRLAPIDYHRIHMMDDGDLIEREEIKGKLYSVNPMSLKQFPNVFKDNHRIVNILKTQNFGYLVMIEIGAFCVGKIVQTMKKTTFKKGSEKGYFLFGGSTVIVIGEKNKWKPSDDILKQSQNNLETLIQLGDVVAVKN